MFDDAIFRARCQLSFIPFFLPGDVRALPRLDFFFFAFFIIPLNTSKRTQLLEIARPTVDPCSLGHLAGDHPDAGPRVFPSQPTFHVDIQNAASLGLFPHE